MIPVDQTVLHSESTRGNCLAACIASLLELPCDEVPNFAAYAEHWMHRCREWLARRGLGIVYVTPDGVALWWQLRECYVLVGGKSPRGDFGHSVVGRIDRGDISVIHDPHPSRAGLAGDPEDVGFLVNLCGAVAP